MFNSSPRHARHRETGNKVGSIKPILRFEGRFFCIGIGEENNSKKYHTLCYQLTNWQIDKYLDQSSKLFTVPCLIAIAVIELKKLS